MFFHLAYADKPHQRLPLSFLSIMPVIPVVQLLPNVSIGSKKLRDVHCIVFFRWNYCREFLHAPRRLSPKKTTSHFFLIWFWSAVQQTLSILVHVVAQFLQLPLYDILRSWFSCLLSSSRCTLLTSSSRCVRFEICMTSRPREFSPWGPTETKSPGDDFLSRESKLRSLLIPCCSWSHY